MRFRGRTQAHGGGTPPARCVRRWLYHAPSAASPRACSSTPTPDDAVRLAFRDLCGGVAWRWAKVTIAP